ncbi:Alanine--tRNA ligase [Coelomomyces lativittatus]|nr:Alanine--tRNA ligase [Coelomomyces lativittatus]KAJ1505474.1 Alanine--tRNA ligase [Coelomomyces lativittatus]
MGDQGPCGPCSEIHYDLLDTGRFVPHLVNADDPTLIEIWNLVFIQFNREPSGQLQLLPSKHVDTGMGFERLVCVLQSTFSNYDTDVFLPLFKEIQRVTGAGPYTGRLGAQDTDGKDMAYRVIADHLRTLTMAISDGGIPSNDGRGYVLRRILRRALRYARSAFQVPLGTFLSSLVDVVVKEMGTIFPELHQHALTVKTILDEEELMFAKTLDRGLKLFEVIRLKSNKIISGHDAFKLYDTFGFPVDLTKLMAEEVGMCIDETAFEQEQAKAKELSRRRKTMDRAQFDLRLDVHAISSAEKKGIAKSNDSFKYTNTSISAKVVGLFKEGHWVEECEGKEDVVLGILLDRTPFYAESGGQEADEGTIVLQNDAENSKTVFEVENVQSFAGYVLHCGTLCKGKYQLGDVVTCSIDTERRTSLTSNHTATHVLNFALNKVLGNPHSVSIDQKGSLVSTQKLRFDFNYKQALNVDQLSMIESECNNIINKALFIHEKNVPLTAAKSINALRAVFGEVYPDPVRVVSVGIPIDTLLADPTHKGWYDFSIELCGGTHLINTKEMNQFVLLEETAIAKGVRRIFACTKGEAEDALALAKMMSLKVDQAAKCSEQELGQTVRDLSKEVDTLNLPAVAKVHLRQRLNELKKVFTDWDKSMKAKATQLAIQEIQLYFETTPEASFLVKKLDHANPKVINATINAVRELPDKAVLLVAVDEESVTYQAFVGPQLTPKLSALDWIRVVADHVDGKMGGKENNAQGVGKKVEQVNKAVDLADDFAKLKLA